MYPQLVSINKGAGPFAAILAYKCKALLGFLIPIPTPLPLTTNFSDTSSSLALIVPPISSLPKTNALAFTCRFFCKSKLPSIVKSLFIIFPCLSFY